MNNPFTQSSVTYKIYFKTIFGDIEKFEKLYENPSLSIVTYEIESKTVDSDPHDIWCIEIYLADKPDINHLQSQLNNYADYNNLKLLSPLMAEKIKDLVWVLDYQKNLKPIEIGSFFITSLAHAHLCPENKTNIIVEASRAFGTGEHATTASCIEAIESLSAKNFDSIIDIGTGSGILSFVAKKMWPRAVVYACDIEKVAIEIAVEGARMNNVDINFFQNSFDKILDEKDQTIKFNLIIINILAKPLIDLATKIKNLSTENSYIILSGFLEDQVANIIKAYSKNDFMFVLQNVTDNWVTIMMKYRKK